LAFVLAAASCGSSEPVDNADGALETASDPANDAANDAADDAPNDAADDQPTPPDPVRVVPLAERDCAHSVAELGQGDGGEPEQDIELPPNEKPPVDEEFLGEVSELITTDLIEGTGREAVQGSQVSMQYVGVLGEDGTEFDASWNRAGQPFDFQLGAGQVIPGWDEGIQGMKVGGRRVLQIPSAQAYGEQARGDIIGANADLVFIVDLLDVSPPPEPAPPIDDSNLGSFGNLQIIDLVEGEGCTAELGDIAQVNYVGVDAEEGEEFDSSWSRGALFSLIVGRAPVIDGWNEGIAGMKVGGERILQIPGDMAYGEGDLVFRVHLDSLVEAPEAHKIEFEGSAPSELEITSLVEGEGDGAETGAFIDAHVMVRRYQSPIILESTWEDGGVTQLALQAGALLPGLEEGLTGIKAGELRQVIIPPALAYPDGVPPEAGFEANDALVFVIEAVRVTNN